MGSERASVVVPDLARLSATITAGPNFARAWACFARLLPDAPIPLTRLIVGGEQSMRGLLVRACGA
jgi:hypothetical protein